MIKVTIFDEINIETVSEKVTNVYPKGINVALKEGLETEEIVIRTVSVDDEECGLTQEVLDDTDVLIWWAHMRHNEVSDEVTQRVVNAVHCGMGAIFLHSAHMAKPFIRLMGTPCTLGWREDGDREFLWVCDPTHHISKDIDRYVYIEEEETYCEPFAIPNPDELVFIANYEGGEAFRAGCCYKRGNGKVFYFQPGHETVPTYYQPEILNIIHNAIEWAAPVKRLKGIDCPKIEKPLAE